MSTRLVLLCTGGTASARAGGFPDPAEPLDASGRAKVQAFVFAGPAPRRCLTSPARAARETAELMGYVADVEPALRDIDQGDWTGRLFNAVAPSAMMTWLAAPEQGAPGGETMADLVARVGPWLDALREADGPFLAITHAAAIRAALAHALFIPIGPTMAIDVAPLSATTLSFNGRWRLQELRRA